MPVRSGEKFSTGTPEELPTRRFGKSAAASVISSVIFCYRRFLEAHVNVSLTPELERLINDKVDTGSYQTASEVVREALRLLKLRDEGLVQLRQDVQAGFDQIERGEFAEYTARSASKLASRVKARGRKRLAELKVPKRRSSR